MTAGSTGGATAGTGASGASDASRFEVRRHEERNGYGVWDTVLSKWASAPTFESERVAIAVAEAMSSKSYGAAAKGAKPK
jgi:hypothetical protein